MTREEVTARLEMMFQECSFPQKRCKGDCCTCSKAIDALQAEPKVVGDIVSRGDTRRVVTVTEPSDLISRADAIETAKELVMFWSDPVYRKEKESDVEDSFNDIPSADIPIPQDLTTEQWDKYIEECRLLRETLSADRPSGEWEYDFDKDDHYCTRCHKYAGDWEMNLLSDYCPSCGARMENTK